MSDKLAPLAVSPAECARLLGVSRPKVYELINRDDFPSFKLKSNTSSILLLNSWAMS